MPYNFLVDYLKVTIIVNDINDNTPQFVDLSQSTQISEAARPGSNVIQMSASDKDLGFAGKVEYNITDGDPAGKSLATCFQSFHFKTDS